MIRGVGVLGLAVVVLVFIAGIEAHPKCLKKVDYWGGDIKRIKARDIRHCHQVCRETDGCVAFTRHDNGNCWIKHKGHRPASNNKHLTSGLMECFERHGGRRGGRGGRGGHRRGHPCIKNVDYWGGDIKRIKADGIRQCHHACRETDGCVAFTRDMRNGNCWIKHKGHRPASKANHLQSGLMECFERHGGRRRGE